MTETPITQAMPEAVSPELPVYDISKIGPNVKTRRKAMSLTRGELSEKAQVNYNTIIKLESGANKNPTVKTLMGISTVFGCRVE
ncbi:MAG TPA: helix-turn-helix transcriptional regulator, partial [bacterium]|nr:helix-turn-helix transcriptional regulator [bacterium]